MKKIFLILGVTAAFMMTACGPTTEDAIDHNGVIVADQKEMLKIEGDFVNAISEDGKISVVEDAYDDYIDFFEKTIKKYDDMDAFDKNDTFRKAMIDLLNAYEDIAKNEWRALINLLPINQFTEQDREDWKTLLEIIDEKEGEAIDDFLDAQKKFAGEYEFELKKG